MITRVVTEQYGSSRLAGCTAFPGDTRVPFGMCVPQVRLLRGGRLSPGSWAAKEARAEPGKYMRWDERGYGG